MKSIKNKTILGAHDHLIAMDVYRPDTTDLVPVVIFAHGFKGFKDWGCWHLIAESFVNQGFAFIKFNFSHNGTTPQRLDEFADLEAFGQNTYSKEASDLEAVLDWTTNEAAGLCLNLKQLSLIGHSRGGGLAIAKAANDDRIKKLVTWAAVPSLAWLWASKIVKEQWQNEGVIYQQNARTGQNMPLYYTLCADYEVNESIFNLDIVAPKVSQPWLIVHGETDTSVLPTAAIHLHHLQSKAHLVFIPNADHTFGGKHPWISNKLPLQSIELVQKTVDFLKV